MTRLTAAVAVVLWAASTAGAQTPSAHRFIQVADGVYAAVGNGTIETRATSGVIINAADVVLVDTNITPEATRRLVADIRTLTDKPIRTVINTHWHYDHADGNQIFGPDVAIIGHENERTTILGGVLKNRLAQEFQALPGQIENAKTAAATEQDATRRKTRDDRVKVLEAYQEQLKETVPTPPTVTFTDHLTLIKGDREIRLVYPGRGHSDTDILVYLPKERVLMTGDFFEGPATGALNFGFHDEWVTNLEPLKTMEYDVIVPGHGEPFRGKERIDYFQAFLRDLWNQTKALHDQKVPVMEAARRVDMSAHKPHYNALPAGPGFQDNTIARIYQVLDQRAAGAR